MLAVVVFIVITAVSTASLDDAANDEIQYLRTGIEIFRYPYQ